MKKLVGVFSLLLDLRYNRHVLRWLRLILPRPVKAGLKRMWDPNETISPKEASLLAQQLAVSQFTVLPQAAGHPPAYDIVCFSIIDWEFRWQRPQQIMTEFAEQGHRVFFLRVTNFLPAGGAVYTAQQLHPNVWEIRLAPPRHIDTYSGDLTPEQLDAVMAGLAAVRADYHISCAVSIVQVATWAKAAYEARDRWDWRIVYDCMDEWNTFPGMTDTLLAQEERLVRSADVLVVTAQRLWDKWSGQNPNPVLARNGADFDHFHNPPPNDLLDGERHPIIGYFGAIADWFDLELMIRLARERPDYTFVLLGGVFNIPVSELRYLSNVHVLGQKPYALMPAYLQHFDVCLIPFKVNAITEATDPVKFYEYISQGKPVVAVRMPELFPYQDYMYIADDPNDFIAKVDLAVSEQDTALRENRIALARQNTWRRRVNLIKQTIVQAHPPISVCIVSYNNLHYTRLCLESVYRNSLYPNLEVIVVDNGSDDGSVDYLQSIVVDYPSLRLILNRHNLGFAAANNQALRQAKGDVLVLLNNDTVVPNGWLPKLIHHLKDRRIGLVVSVTNFSGNESRIEVPYHDLAGMEEFAAVYTRDHEGQVFDIRVAAMYCVAMRREVYQKVGPLDEQFTIGLFEDDDYSHRVRLAGWRVVCAEDAYIHHFGQASFKKLGPAELQRIWDHNQHLYETKWGLTWERHQTRQ